MDKPAKKNFRISRLSLCILVALILCAAALFNIILFRNYRNAIACLTEERYEEALNILHKLPEGYKSTEELTIYSEAHFCEKPEDRAFIMKRIPDTYSGDLYSKIQTYKEQVSEEYNAWLIEENKKAMLERKEKLARLQEEASGKYPSYGMREEELKYCALGTPDVELCKDFYGLVPRARYKTYRFGNRGKPNSGEITVRYRWQNGSRSDIYIDYPASNGYAAYGYYFDADGIRYDFDFQGKKINTTVSPAGGTQSTKNKQNLKKTTETDKSDPYNVYDYEDPEEFYFDWKYDFAGFEDAEQYWEDAQ